MGLGSRVPVIFYKGSHYFYACFWKDKRCYGGPWRLLSAKFVCGLCELGNRTDEKGGVS